MTSHKCLAGSKLESIIITKVPSSFVGCDVGDTLRANVWLVSARPRLTALSAALPRPAPHGCAAAAVVLLITHRVLLHGSMLLVNKYHWDSILSSSSSSFLINSN